DAAGADGVVLGADAVDPYNPKCVRASAGSVFHLPVGLAGPAELAGLLERLGRDGVRRLAAAPDGETDLDELADGGELFAPPAWVFGSEAHGLPPGILELTDTTVRIPMYGAAESLNIATAAAVCLFASARAQR